MLGLRRLVRVVVLTTIEEIEWQRQRTAVYEPGPLAWFATILCEIADALRK